MKNVLTKWIEHTKNSIFDITMENFFKNKNLDEYNELLTYCEKNINDSNCLYFVGVVFCLNKKYDKAIEFYSKAINLGNSSAMNNLAIMYANGIGIKQDYNKAIELYNKAINLGSSVAMNILAIMYENEKGTKQNYSKAIELYNKAINLGDYLCMNNLACMYKMEKELNKITIKL